MIFYVVIWFLFCINNAAIIGISIYSYSEIGKEGFEALKRIVDDPRKIVIIRNMKYFPNDPVKMMNIASTISFMFVPDYILMLCLDLMILLIYYNFGNRLSEGGQQKVE